MDASLAMQINALLSRGSVILGGLSREWATLDAPGSVLGRQLITEGAGQIAAELLGMKKARSYGKKVSDSWLQGEKKKAQQQIVNNFYGQYRAWLADVVSLLSQVSISSSRLIAPGNSAVLVKRVKRAESFKRLNTRIRHVITQLEEMGTQNLVWNHDLPKALPAPAKEVAPDPRETLRRIEELLRHCIERELLKQTPNWWTTMIPADIRSRADGRKLRRETVWPWYPPTSGNVVDYLDFSDYKKIILHPSNWSAAFRVVFGTPTFIESRLDELEPIRNDLAHSRGVSGIARAKLKIYAEELSACIRPQRM